MSNNTTLNVGAGGDVIASDDIGGVKYQRVKLTMGAEGVNDGDLSASNPMPVVDTAAFETQQDMIALLTRMLNYLNSPVGYDKSLQRQRGIVIVESGTINVGTLSTLVNQSLIGGIQAQILPNGANLSAWQACVRSRIT